MPENTDTPGVYIEEVNSIAGHIVGVSTSTTAFIDIFKEGPIGKATPISSIEEFTNIFGGVDDHSEASYGIYQFFINGGTQAVVVRVPGRKAPGKKAIIVGLNTLASDKKVLIKILCIPAVANLKERSMRSVYTAAIEYCEASRTFLIIDISERIGQLDQMIEWMNKNTALRSPNTAVYFPRIEIRDPINLNHMREVSPSGTIAGIFARTDSKRGVWKAPAGNHAVLKGVLGLGHNLTPCEIEDLFLQGINCIRKFPDQGIVCWGARTLGGHVQGVPEWKYISVRRLFLYVEDSIYRGIQWVVFEPNDANLWLGLQETISGFLSTMWRQGAFAGQRPQDAYFVKCDRTTMSQEEIDQGIVNILIGVAILTPAEFVLIRIRQLTGTSVET